MPDPSRVTRRDFITAPVAGHARAADFWLRVHRQIMACRFEIVLPGEAGGATPLAREALDYADRLEEVMTIFRDTSELSRVNRGGHAGPVVVGPVLFAVLALCAEVHRETDGAFDVTSTPLSRCWGFLGREPRLPAPGEIEQARSVVGMQHVRLDREGCSVSFDRPGVSLNLGAIGKGYALDRLGALLQRRGVRRVLLSAGSSSILASGGQAEPWQVDLRSTVIDERLVRLHLAHGAVGTSGAGEQFVEVDGVRYGHVIDPRTGCPAGGVLSASVITTDAASADALSTAFLIGGPDLAQRYCSTHPDVIALITLDDGSRRPMTFGAYPGVRMTHG